LKKDKTAILYVEGGLYFNTLIQLMACRYLLYDSFDVSEQLMWLAGELLAAEQANIKVHILAHIPLSSDCFPGYARQYNRLIDR
jgi:hypothetical protein